MGREKDCIFEFLLNGSLLESIFLLFSTKKWMSFFPHIIVLVIYIYITNIIIVLIEISCWKKLGKGKVINKSHYWWKFPFDSSPPNRSKTNCWETSLYFPFPFCFIFLDLFTHFHNQKFLQQR